MKVYKDFTEGKLSKGELTTIIQKVEKEESELTQIKLRKVRIEKIKNETKSPFDNDNEDVSKPKSMKDLLAMFGGDNSSKNGPKGGASGQPAFTTKVTVVEEDNVGPGQAFKKKEPAPAIRQ